jgi:hypothetical protein
MLVRSVSSLVVGFLSPNFFGGLQVSALSVEKVKMRTEKCEVSGPFYGFHLSIFNAPRRNKV